jgi:hypothetical protein
MSLSAQTDENRSPARSPPYIDITQTPTRASTLSMLRSVTPANVGRRRMQMASLLSSPARRGHQQQISNIFRNAATSLDATKIISAPRRIIQEDESSSNTDMNNMTEPENAAAVNYPALPKSPDHSPPFIANSKLLVSARAPVRLSHSPRHRRDNGFPHSVETVKQQRFLQKLGRPDALKFKRKESSLSVDHSASSSSSTSSASWTGDSQFYVKKLPVVPTNEQQGIVSKWLDLLPATPEEHTEAQNEEVETLSPDVEIERGSMRRRLRGWTERERCVSLDDDDIFSAVLR